MKKLYILKSLVDFVWYVTCIPLIPLTLFFAVYMFFDKEIIQLFFKLELHLGISPYLSLICLGLFSMVLSELFKVVKKENELTI